MTWCRQIIRGRQTSSVESTRCNSFRVTHCFIVRMLDEWEIHYVPISLKNNTSTCNIGAESKTDVKRWFSPPSTLITKFNVAMLIAMVFVTCPMLCDALSNCLPVIARQIMWVHDQECGPHYVRFSVYNHQLFFHSMGISDTSRIRRYLVGKYLRQGVTTLTPNFEEHFKYLKILTMDRKAQIWKQTALKWLDWVFNKLAI